MIGAASEINEQMLAACVYLIQACTTEQMASSAFGGGSSSTGGGGSPKRRFSLRFAEDTKPADDGVTWCEAVYESFTQLYGDYASGFFSVPTPISGALVEWIHPVIDEFTVIKNVSELSELPDFIVEEERSSITDMILAWEEVEHYYGSRTSRMHMCSSFDPIAIKAAMCGYELINPEQMLDAVATAEAILHSHRSELATDEMMMKSLNVRKWTVLRSIGPYNYILRVYMNDNLAIARTYLALAESLEARMRCKMYEIHVNHAADDCSSTDTVIAHDAEVATAKYADDEHERLASIAMMKAEMLATSPHVVSKPQALGHVSLIGVGYKNACCISPVQLLIVHQLVMILRTILTTTAR